jgi:hypothetical protein
VRGERDKRREEKARGGKETGREDDGERKERIERREEE